MVNDVVAVILAAGQSTRMGSSTSKLLHRLGSRCLVERPVEACEQVGVSRIILVVGYQAENIKAALGQDRCEYVLQSVRRGTGDAVAKALAHLGSFASDVLVLPGDAPLLRPGILQHLLASHRRTGVAVTVLTARLENPGAYGRIVRDAEGNLERIVEFKNATTGEKALREVNSGVYCFRAPPLREAVSVLQPNAVTGEIYITDAIAVLRQRGTSVQAVQASDPRVVLGVNTPEELDGARSLLATEEREEEDAT